MVVLAIEIELGSRLEDEPVSEENVVLAFKACCCLPTFTKKGGGFRFESIQSHPLKGPDKSIR